MKLAYRKIFLIKGCGGRIAYVGIDSRPINREGADTDTSEFHVKDYPSTYGSLQQRKELIDNLSKAENCTYLLSSQVYRINKVENQYRIHIINIVTRNHEIIIVDNIILATGRLGNLALNELMPDIAIKKNKLRYEFGIRIETKSDIGFLSRSKSPDVKAIWKTKYGEIRTFCTCRNGEVWSIPYGELSAISGRSDGPKTGFSNFGLLMRFAGNKFSDGEQYFNSVLNTPLIKKGEIAWQSLSSFLDLDIDSSNQNRSVNRPWYPRDKFTHSSLIEIIGKDIHNIFKVALNKLLEWSPDLLNSETRVLFPAIEGTGAYPLITDNLQIEDENIWVCGDLAGTFRGIIPAFLSGHYAASNCLRLENQHLLNLRNSSQLTMKIHNKLRSSIRIGVGVIILNNENKVLLGKRLSSHSEGSWSFPGGHLEESETFIECATRETKEEAGLDVADLVFGPQTYDEFEESKKKYTTLFMVTKNSSGILQLKEPDKFTEWKWFDWDSLPEPLFKPIQTLIQQGFTFDHLLKLVGREKNISTSKPKIKNIMKSKFKIVSFDMDGTIIPNTTSSLHFAELLGVKDEVLKLEDEFQRGLVDSTQFMNKISLIMKELSIQFIRDNLHTLQIIDGLAETVEELRSHGIITVIVTTSGQAYANAIKEKYSFDYAYGTEFEVLSDGRIGKGLKVCSSTEKIRRIGDLTRKHSASMDQVAAIGDSLSDIPLFSQVGFSIAINYHDCLKGKAHVYLRTNNIKDILSFILSSDLKLMKDEATTHSSQNHKLPDFSSRHALNPEHRLSLISAQSESLSSHDLCDRLIDNFDNNVEAIFSSKLYLRILPDDFCRISASLLRIPLSAQQYKQIAKIFESDNEVKLHFGVIGIAAINESMDYYIQGGDKTVNHSDFISPMYDLAPTSRTPR